MFDRVVIMGGEMPDGQVADSNYVWLSSWQLENVNQNYLLPVDFETYRGLRNNIAKALVPLLQLWLYASRANGVFEKRYDDLCELLSLRPQKYPSDIEKQLGPSLDELKVKGFLATWALELTNDGRAYKICACHGPKFFADQRALTGSAVVNREGDDTPSLLQALIKRDVMEPQAKKLLRGLAADQPVFEQIEYIDHIVKAGKIENPPGFYITMLKNNIPVPDGFETSSRRLLREQSENKTIDKQRTEFEQRSSFDSYIQQELEKEITRIGIDELRLRAELKLPECTSRYPRLPQKTLWEVAESYVRLDMRNSLPLMTFDLFVREGTQAQLFEKQ